MTRAYAIGDVHGHLDLLRRAHERIARDMRATGDHDAPVIHLGDYVDRGPDSAGVLDFIAAGPTRGTWISLIGNHDNLFRLFVEEGKLTDGRLRSKYIWLDQPLGGMTTLASYGIDTPERMTPDELIEAARAKVPAAHRALLAAMPHYTEAAGAIFVHAGIQPGVPMDQQDPMDLMWIRGPFHEHTAPHGALIVHGHTPVDTATHYGNRLNLDSGAAYGGPLSAAVIEDGESWLLTDDGRVPLRPQPR